MNGNKRTRRLFFIKSGNLNKQNIHDKLLQN
jgi:hypothetical protein